MESALLAPPEKFDVGGRMILKLRDNLSLKCFWLIHSLKNANRRSENELKKKSRGSFDQLVR